MLKWALAVFALLSLVACTQLRQPDKAPPSSSTAAKTAAPMVFNWHGGRAGLDRRGAGGDPVGLGDLVAGGVTHVGIPQNNSGDFGHRNYITQIRALDIKIVRTIEQSWNAGLEKRDLGALILAWQTPQNPGAFFVEFAANLAPPCDGIAWNLEHNILDSAAYPLTAADRELAALWRADLADPAGYIDFRGRQFALLFQIYYQVAQSKYPSCQLAIGYSGYQGLQYHHQQTKAAYGCDWDQLARPQTWRGHRFEPITHAMCAWHQSVELPAPAGQPTHNLPILHNIQLAPLLATEQKNIRGQIRDRLARLRPGDGLGTVGYGSGPVWDGADRQVHLLLADEVLRSYLSEPAR